MRFQASLHPRSRSAFSLIELCLAMAIMVTLAGIAMPRYAQSMARYRALAAAQRIVNDLQLAQTNARATSSSQSIIFSNGLDGYAIAAVKDLETSASNYTVKLTDEPYRSTIARIDLLDGSQVVIFDGFGVPNQGGSIVVVSGSESKTVQLDAASGRATIQ